MKIQTLSQTWPVTVPSTWLQSLGFQSYTPIYLLFLPYLFSISVSFYSVSSLSYTFQMLSLPQALSLELCFTHSDVISLSSVTLKNRLSAETWQIYL